jgi:hypothetical protein
MCLRDDYAHNDNSDTFICTTDNDDEAASHMCSEHFLINWAVICTRIVFNDVLFT